MIDYEGNGSMGLPKRAVPALVEVASRELSIVAEFQQADGNLLSYPRGSPDGTAFVFVLDHFDGEEFLGEHRKALFETKQ
jgi:hypothetical protein